MPKRKRPRKLTAKTLAAVLARHQSTLLGPLEACAVRVGTKVTRAVRTKQPAIVVFVRHKLPPSRLGPMEAIPTTVDGIATDVQTWQFDSEALRAFLKAKKRFTGELINAGRSAEGVYHYTNLEGLRSIVSNHDLWLTHSRYSNDDEEITLGYARAKEAIALARGQRSLGTDWPAYLDRVESLLERPSSQGVYICCFCREDNLLSQWRGYSANGIGVSLEIDPARFAFTTRRDSPVDGLMRFWGVIYEPERQRALVVETLRFMYGYARPKAAVLPFQERARLAADCIEFCVPTFKHADFKDERECRLIFTPDDWVLDRRAGASSVRFRSARGMLVPYFSLRGLLSDQPDVERLPITGVRIGPCPQKALNRASAEMLLRSKGYLNVPVHVSGTPYRG